MKNIRLFSLSLIVLCLAIFLLGSSSLLQVDEIVVQGNQKLSLEDIKQKLESFQGKNLLLINLNEVAFKLAADKRIATVEVSRSWPNRITVNLSEKKPVLLLRTSPIWGLTPTGEVLPVDPSDTRRSSLPRLTSRLQAPPPPDHPNCSAPNHQLPWLPPHPPWRREKIPLEPFLRSRHGL